MSDLKNFWQDQMKDPAFRGVVDKMQARREVANAIFNARIAKDLTQKDLANLAKVSQGDISRFENEEKDINLNTLDKIARALGYRVKIEFISPEEADKRL